MYNSAVLFILIAPFVGLNLIHKFPDDYYWLTSGSSSVAPVIYYAFFLFGSSIAVLQFKSQSIDDSLVTKRQFHSEYPLLIFLLIITTILMIGYGGLSVLSGEISKEDVRQSGFVHALLSKYLAPSIFAYLSAKYRMLSLSRVQWLLALLMIFFVGLSTGGKASALIVILPGLAIIFHGRLNLFKISIFGALAFGSLMVSAWLFDSFLGGDVVKIAEYLLRRAFALTAESPFHISVAYESNQPLIEYSYTLLEVFGKSVLSHFGFSHDLHKYLFSFAVTAWLYPSEIDNILNGAWNITPNVFVEALILGGGFMLPFFGWLVVYVAFSIWNRVIKKLNQGKFSDAAITSVYAVLVYLSWINSAGIMQLVHPLAIISLFFSWLFLNTLSRTSFRLKVIRR